MSNIEMIEAYCNHELSEEKQREFEQRIVGDPLFADEVAFYMSTKQFAASAMMEKRADLRRVFEEYKKERPLSKPQPALMRRILPWVAAAAVVAAIVWGLTIFRQPSSYQELADKYVKENLSVLSVTMGSKQDSLQAGLALYNEGKLQEAQKQFESLVANDTASVEAKKYAGIVALRLGEYDKAINHFTQLESYTHLYSNPGKFYHALALMKRDQPGDAETAKQLLNEVVQNNLEGEKEAEEWLKK
ncbi:tetratricopeptide repeat protein [Terrimonas pollutisoli]|uniref:tetratricopeptide repeat protein n=1 Tax=Terrimonas pollutisoli TaxID=3034147 RepID=UPI0023EC4C37|nr:hypothetical protein [Terrimonas sp. H1YJ31]